MPGLASGLPIFPLKGMAALRLAIVVRILMWINITTVHVGYATCCSIVYLAIHSIKLHSHLFCYGGTY